MAEQEKSLWLEWMESLAIENHIPLELLIKMAHEDAAEELFRNNKGLRKWEKKFLKQKKDEKQSVQI